jgi:hypothetical protein
MQIHFLPVNTNVRDDTAGRDQILAKRKCRWNADCLNCRVNAASK